MNTDIQVTILRNLIHSRGFASAVLPYLKEEYFTDNLTRRAFVAIASFVAQYKDIPTLRAIDHILTQDNKLTDVSAQNKEPFLDDVFSDPGQIESLEFMSKETEAWVQQRECENKISLCIDIISGAEKNFSRSQIPQLLSEAVSVCFDAQVGHDYFEDSEARFEHYKKPDNRLKTRSQTFNTLLNGGTRRKTLNVIVAPTGKGKSTALVDLTAQYLEIGLNVLYITMEMEDIEIAKRVDANLLNISMDLLPMMSTAKFQDKISDVHKVSNGQLFIKEYPTSSASSAHFRHLLNELKLKKKFVPDVIMIDYLNICSSARMKFSDSSYTYVKAIAEEIRGLASEFNACIWSATQSKREAQNASDFDLEEVSESHGLSASCDFMMAMISTDEMERQKQIKFKRLKTRYGDLWIDRYVVAGLDRSKMKITDINQATLGAWKNSGEVPQEKPEAPEPSTPVFDRGRSEGKKNFGGFKFT